MNHDLYMVAAWDFLVAAWQDTSTSDGLQGGDKTGQEGSAAVKESRHEGDGGDVLARRRE